ncbi:primase C-terminal domain-containing protein [Seonamhaeicola sp. MEBiC1930]|uniref:BT4734/BF3469 family protein n=1 Tax=Seonamhaeicola sp. MEBiC01930 TaxID=2976768 RepID=UPI00324E9976
MNKSERLQSNVTIFKTLYSKYPKTITLEKALNRIRNGASKELVQQIRGSSDAHERNRLKKQLPPIAFGGEFDNRTKQRNSSGIACVDYDKVKDIARLKKELKSDKYVLAFWLSPSGNGIKALVKIPLVHGAVRYKEHYTEILKHFAHLSPDKSTSDVNRLCFESYDPNLYFNPNAKTFRKRKRIEINRTYTLSTTPEVDDNKKIDRIMCWWSKNFGFNHGERNNNLFILACSLGEFGIPQPTTSFLFDAFVSQDFAKSEVESIIRSAYKKVSFNSKSFTSWARQLKN